MAPSSSRKEVVALCKQTAPCGEPYAEDGNICVYGGGEQSLAHRGCLHCRVLMRLCSLRAGAYTKRQIQPFNQRTVEVLVESPPID